MLKKTLKFEDFDGNIVEETHYFNMTRAEVTEFDLMYQDKGGFEEYIKRISSAKDNREIWRVVKEIVLSSYGVKPANSTQFIKSKEIAQNFVNSLAFDALMMSFFEERSDGGNNLVDFINGVLPKVKTEQSKPKSLIA